MSFWLNRDSSGGSASFTSQVALHIDLKSLAWSSQFEDLNEFVRAGDLVSLPASEAGGEILDTLR